MNVCLGYACINTTLKDKDKTCVNKTCRLETAIQAGKASGHPKGTHDYSLAIYNFLSSYGIHNLKQMYKVIIWSRKHGIYFYRISSNVFPHVNNPRLMKHMLPQHQLSYASLYFAHEIIYDIGRYCQKYGIRLTMHPDHFNQLGAPSKEVVYNTFLDLDWHGRLLEMLSDGAASYLSYKNSDDDNIIDNSILCIHGGGQYGDKEATLERWRQRYHQLPDYVKSRICVENDEKGYCVEDLLPLCEDLNIPLIFDFHHYNCWAYYHKDNPHQAPISELLPKILATWHRRGIKPKFHLSDQDQNKKIGAHHDYVEDIPPELISLIQSGYKLDIMIEAKKKELATLKLIKKYHDILVNEQ